MLFVWKGIQMKVTSSYVRIQCRNNNLFYDLPTTIARRSAGIGYGQKLDFTAQFTKTPGPNQYRSYTDFDKDRPASNAFSFGVPRGACGKQFIEGHKSPDPKIPGPGSYNLLRPFGSNTPKYTFRVRPKVESYDTSLKNPGPGTYTPKITMPADGNYFYSKFKNSRSAKFSPISSQRFQEELKCNRNLPGPGQYNQNSTIQNDASIKTPYAEASAKKAKKTSPNFQVIPYLENLHTPGPGTYAPISEFGPLPPFKKFQLQTMSLTTSIDRLKNETSISKVSNKDKHSRSLMHQELNSPKGQKEEKFQNQEQNQLN